MVATTHLVMFLIVNFLSNFIMQIRKDYTKCLAIPRLIQQHLGLIFFRTALTLIPQVINIYFENAEDFQDFSNENGLWTRNSVQDVPCTL